MSEALRIVTATARKYLKGAADNTIRRRLMLALLRKHGRITYDHTGETLYWDVEFDEPNVLPYGSGQVLNYTPHDAYKQASLPWRGYKATDALTEKDRLMNRGAVAIVEYYTKIFPKLKKTMEKKFCGELFIDGNAANNEDRIHGFESALGDSTCAIGDRIAVPSDTYGGLSTGLASFGGSWSSALGTGNFPNATIATDWPNGQGSVKYDYFSPKLINWGSNAWANSSTAWVDNCVMAMRQMLIWLNVTGGDDSIPTIVHLASDLWAGFLNHHEDQKRILVPHKQSEDLGFSSTVNFDGAAINYEYDVPAGVGYAVNLDEVEINSLYEDLFHASEITVDPYTENYLWKLGFFGNMRMNPKHMAKLADFTD